MRTGALTVLILAVGVSFSAAQTVSGSSSTNASSSTSVSASRSGAAVDSKSSAQSSNNVAVSPRKDQHEKPTTRQDAKESKHHGSTTSKDEPIAASDATLKSGSMIKGVLTKSVDSRKAKPGDQVVLKTTEDIKSDGKVVVPRGSKVIGHVTEVSAQGEGKASSSLGLMFDRAELKDGSSVALNTVVQAMAQSQANASPIAEDMSSANANLGASARQTTGSGGGLLRSVGATAGSTAGAVTDLGASAGSNLGGTLNSATQTTLTSTSTGVVGLQGLALNSELSNATNGSVITSTGKSVRLDSGTQFLLKAQ